MLLPYSKVKILVGVSLVLVLFVMKPDEFYYIYLANYFHISILSLNIIVQTITWVELIVVYFYSIRIEKQTFLLWIESTRSIGFYIYSIFYIIFIIFVGGAFIYYLMYRYSLYNIFEKLHVSNLTSISIKLLLYVTTAAVVEELIFRAYLMSRLQLFFKNKYLTVFISAIIFALAHISLNNIAHSIFPLFSGFIFAYFYWKYKNIKILITCHFLTDLIFVLLQK